MIGINTLAKSSKVIPKKENWRDQAGFNSTQPMQQSKPQLGKSNLNPTIAAM